MIFAKPRALRDRECMKVAVFHPGTQHSWQTARALQDLDRLAWYATSIFYRPDRLPYSATRLMPRRARAALEREFARFAPSGIDPALVRTHGLGEWAERAALRLGWRQPSAWFDRAGNRAFERRVGADARREGELALWGYNGSSVRVFRDPDLADCPRILDRTIGDWRAWNRVRAELREAWPGWSITDDHHHPPQAIDADDREYAAADRIVCGSAFVRDTILAESPLEGLRDKLTVLPYCHDEELFGGAPEPRPVERGAPLRFLFVGHLSLRKGIQHVLEAIARLPASQASLTVAGPPLIAQGKLAHFRERIDYRGNLPRSAIPALMREHHVLLLPSHFEGSAITLLEALASGMAVIQSPQAGRGASEETGIVIERPDVRLLEAAMVELIENRGRLDAMRQAAWRGAEAHGFAAYRDNIAALLGDMGL